MDALFPTIEQQSFADPLWQHAVAGAMQTFVAFTLVAARLAGMTLVGPVFGSPGIPIGIRVVLVASMALVVTPSLLSIDSERTFARLDRNQDGRLYVDEVAPTLRAQFGRLLAEAGKKGGDPLLTNEFRLSRPVPPTLVDYAWLGLIELALGAALGLGVTTILFALQMAGNLIDQQLAISPGEVFNPQFGGGAGPSGQMLHRLGLVVFLIGGGHLLVVSAVLDTFRALPVGYAWIGPPAFELLCDLVRQSLVLATHVAAPVLATMAVVGTAAGLVERALPRLNMLAVGLPVRMLVGLLVLGLSLSSIADLVDSTLPDTVLNIRRVLMGSSGGFDE